MSAQASVCNAQSGGKVTSKVQNEHTHRHADTQTHRHRHTDTRAHNHTYTRAPCCMAVAITFIETAGGCHSFGSQSKQQRASKRPLASQRGTERERERVCVCVRERRTHMHTHMHTHAHTHAHTHTCAHTCMHSGDQWKHVMQLAMLHRVGLTADASVHTMRYPRWPMFDTVQAAATPPRTPASVSVHVPVNCAVNQRKKRGGGGKR